LLVLHDWLQPSIEIRRSEDGEPIGQLTPGENSLAFADPACRHLIVTNGKTIESGTFDDLVSPMKTVMRTMVVGSQVAFTSDGQILAAQSVPQELQLIRWSTGECLAKLAFDFSDNITQLAFDPTDRYLVALCARTGVVRKWDIHGLNAALRDDGLEFK
jgi:WD40 repeat protein